MSEQSVASPVSSQTPEEDGAEEAFEATIVRLDGAAVEQLFRKAEV